MVVNVELLSMTTNLNQLNTEVEELNWIYLFNDSVK